MGKTDGRQFTVRIRKYEDERILEFCRAQSNFSDTITYLIENEIKANGIRNLQTIIPAFRDTLAAVPNAATSPIADFTNSLQQKDNAEAVINQMIEQAATAHQMANTAEVVEEPKAQEIKEVAEEIQEIEEPQQIESVEVVNDPPEVMPEKRKPGRPKGSTNKGRRKETTR